MNKAIINDGKRRVVIGPPAGGGRALKFDTKADSKVKEESRLGTRHELTDDEAKRIHDSKAYQAMKNELGLRQVG